ncbi:hypothetical protein [Candidatus Thioglobus autotrophicus]|uniref:hypothetical protein n=1 Tax=Candidatus Thioglobus autotrophicus TaxID=1705394 RepID=UPI00299F1465|nr:hypothetical protein [Candidatus Thioglobus autotrophicus]WPE17165.1 hypothetical protein R5P06_03635 [Candidatus Thioglobus autotrophicus]WPE18727.1 hypothetical protein R5P05_03720 [Candidatus Thioglobus autotrophicus]
MHLFVKLIKINLIVVVTIAALFSLTILLGDAPGHFDAYLKFIMGGKILLLLIFGFAVIPGFMIVFFYAPFVVDIEGALVFSLIHTFVPVGAVYLMNFTKVSNFKDLTNIDFRHIVFLVILTTLFSSIFKYTFIAEFTDIEINAATFVGKYFISHTLGSLILIYAVLKIIPHILSKFNPSFNN